MRADLFARWILSHRVAVASLLLVLTGVAMLGIYDPIRGVPRLRVDPSLNEMLPEDDVARRFYAELLERFGSDDVVLVSLRSEALFTPVGLQTLVRVTQALERIDGVHHVDGLANALRVRPVDGDVEISGFLDHVPTQLEAAQALRSDVLDDPLRAGTFVSGDGTATAILVTFDPIPEDEFLLRGLDLEVIGTARDEVLRSVGQDPRSPEFEVRLAGTPYIKAEVGRLLTSELGTMVPVVFVLMSALSCLFFRSLWIGLVPIAAVALGLVWTVGVMGWVGHDLNVVTTLIPPLVLALGFAYATHVVTSFRHTRVAPSETGVAGAVPGQNALAHVVFPVCFTALTTAAGFLSLTSNGLDVIRGFGVFAAVSTFATLLASLTLVPLLLSMLGGESQSVQGGSTRRLDAFFGWLAQAVARRSGSVLVAAGVLVVLSLGAATRIEVNLPVIENFGKQTEIRLAYEEVDRLFSGANQFFVMLRAEQPGDFEDPERLAAVASLQTWLEAQPEVGLTTSVVDYLEVLNEALGPEAVPTRRLPESDRLIAQLLLFGGNEELDVLIDRAHQVITILVRSTATETREFDRLAARIDERLAELPTGITGQTTGNAILLSRAADRISRGQAISLVLACGMIGLLLIGYFRSLRLGLFALIPNVLPVVLYFGLLGLTGTTLNNSTALMGSIVLGIAVDDTLHLLVEYRRELQKGVAAEAALRTALIHVGRAITCTTLAVCLGLLVVGASALRNQAEFGLLGAGTLAAAWIIDVTVTPALCLRWLRRS